MKTKIFSTLILLAGLSSVNPAIAGGKPAFEFPSAYQCIFLSYANQLRFSMTSNTAWDRCREAYRRAKGIDITIKATIESKGRNYNIYHKELLTAGKIIMPRFDGIPGRPYIYTLNPQSYILRGVFDVYARWVF